MKLGLRARKTKCEKVSKQLLPPLDHRKWKKEEEKAQIPSIVKGSSLRENSQAWL